MTDVKCAHKGCDLSARWLPVLLIKPSAGSFPDGVVPPSAIARGQAGMPICDAHKDVTTADDFITPEGFAQISAGFTSQGYAAPDPDIGLDFEPLPLCGDKKAECRNPAVVKVIWIFPGEASAGLLVCSEHLPDVRRILIEHSPAPGVHREEFDLVPRDLWR